MLETDADDAPRRSFVHGSQYIDERVLIRLPNGEEYYYLPRELYSVAALTDETGTIVEAATYDTYGQVTVYDGSAQAVEESPVGNPYYFTGRRLDLVPTVHSPQPISKQLYHYRARAYDPGNGRFMQRDPLDYIGDANLYQFCQSRPLDLTDAHGRGTSEEIKALLAALAGIEAQIAEVQGTGAIARLADLNGARARIITKLRQLLADGWKPGTALPGAVICFLTITSEANAAEIQWYPTTAYAAHRRLCDERAEQCRGNCSDLYPWWNPWAGSYRSSCLENCSRQWSRCDRSYEGKRYTLCDPDLPGCEESEF